MGSRTFTTVLWYNSSPVCSSPTQRLCGMTPGSTVVLMVTSSKRTYANTPYLPKWLLPVPLSPWQATADLCLHRRPLNTTGISGSVSCWGRILLSLRSQCAQGFVCALQESLEGIAFDFNMIAPLLPSRRGFFFVFQSGVSFFFFFGEFQHPPVNCCSAASCKFGGILAGEDECMSFCSTILKQDPKGLHLQVE